MNEEQLTNLLAEHLDAVLAGGPIPADVPAEVAELLAMAQPLAETAPSPDPAFGLALKEALPAPNSGAVTPGATFTGPTLFTLVIGLLVTVGGIALVASLVIIGGVRSNLAESTAPPIRSTPPQTVTRPAAATSPAWTPSPTAPPAPTQTAPAQSPIITATVASPTLTATPIIDVLPVVTLSVDIGVDPPSLVPGSGGSGGGDGGSSSSGGSDGGGGGGGGGSSGGDDDDDGDDNDD